MERMLVVIFNDEAKAYEGSHALKQLDDEGSIAIHGAAVIKKNADGTVTVKEEEEDFPIRAAAGTAIGALIGLLEGPFGMGVGAVAGALAGSIGDLHVAGVDAAFVDKAGATLTAGKCALIADLSEEWVTPVDTRMESLGGTVFRTTRRLAVQDELADEVSTLRAEIDQMKTELTRVRGERKAKLQATIDQLNGRLRSELEHAKQRTEQMQHESAAKVRALQKKAEEAKGSIKATYDARVKSIRRQYTRSEARLKHSLAGHLRQAAAKVEK